LPALKYTQIVVRCLKKTGLKHGTPGSSAITEAGDHPELVRRDIQIAVSGDPSGAPPNHAQRRSPPGLSMSVEA
jgi:hypothetical protein